MMTIAQKKAALETRLAQVCGVAVELTVRGEKSFTVSTETAFQALGDKISGFFGEHAEITVEHDDELGSFAFIEARI